MLESVKMPILGYILIFTLLGSVFSLIGGMILLWKEKLALKISHFLASFAAGALLGTAFLDLLPEALSYSEELGLGTNIFVWALSGILVFFLLERFIYFFHHHHEHEEDLKPTVPLVMFGDSVHNFIDGVVIAGTFLVSIPLGIVTTVAVAAHEIPQEIGDFGIMLHKGVPRSKILLLNFFSALSAIAGATLTFFIGAAIDPFLPILLSITAGFFIYIAASDLIPEIHEEKREGFAFIESLLLIIGVLVIYLSVFFLEGH